MSTRGGDSRGQGEGTIVKATRPVGRGDFSLSYNPPRDCNISSLILNNLRIIKLKINL